MSTTLLAVDDSVTMRKVLEITFAGEDYRIVTADSADAALKKARAEKPNIVVLDVTLPGQDGYAVCRALKSEMPSIGVVILSSKQGPYDQAKGSAAGADDFIDKPFDTQSMIEKIRKLVAAKAAATAQPPTPPKQPEAAAPPRTGVTGTLPGGGQPAQPSAPMPPAQPARPPAATPPGGMARGTQVFGSPAAPPPAAAASPPAAAPKPVAPTPTAPTPLRSQTLLGGQTASSSTATTATSQPAQQLRPQPPAPVAVQQPAAPAVPARPTAPQPTPAPSPVAAAVDGQMADKLSGLGLTPAQAEAVLALSREVVERVVWEVVPQLAEVLIKEEIKRLTAEG